MDSYLIQKKETFIIVCLPAKTLPASCLLHEGLREVSSALGTWIHAATSSCFLRNWAVRYKFWAKSQGLINVCF